MERGKDFYDARYTRRRYKRRNRGVWRYIIRNWLGAGLRILDVGCGDGPFGRLCIDLGCSYVGVDISSVAIENAKKLVPEAKFHCADMRVNRSLVTEGDYEVIVFLEFLEHIEKDREVLMEIPSGKTVLFSVPTFWSKEHVRIYETEQDIIDRYQDLLEIQHIKALHKRGKIRKYAVKATRK